MQIRIETQPLGPLRVLPELPDARLAILEGLNGIGKTLAVRLLQICATGLTPYRADSLAWVSLCNGLGSFRIQISGLRGGGTIEWVADSRDWLGKDDVGSLFARISINGKKSTIADIRQLLVVHRLAGDETLIETLAQQAESSESVIRRWASFTASATDSPIARLENLASETTQELGEWTAARRGHLLDDLQAAETAVKAAHRAAEAAGARSRKLTEAAELRHRLEQLRSSAPDLRQRIEAVDSGVATVREQLDALRRRSLSLAGHAATRGSAIRELRNAQRTLRRNQSGLSTALNAARAAAAELQLDATVAACQAADVVLRQQIAELTKSQTVMDAAPAMRALLDEVSRELREGEGHGLADQIALDDPETGFQLTVTETRVGITTRRVQLEGQPPPPAAKEVSEHLTVAQHRLARVAQLAEALESVARHTRLAAANEQRVDRALSKANPGALAELQGLELQRRVLDQQLLELAAQRAVLRQQLGSLGEETTEAMESRLAAVLDELGSPHDTTPAAIDGARAFERAAHLTLEEARHRLASLRREVARAEAEVKRTTRKLASGQLRWLREALKSPTELDETAPLERQLAEIDRARARTELVIERLGKHRTQLAAIGSALRGIGRQLRGQDAEAVEYVPQLEKWFSLRFSEWFNADKVRRELLPEADDRISVDVRQREVRWLEKGHERSRPLEAFSSGEQAFAYTRARLAVLDEDATAPNRLIVLDEFGAFIAHDRLSGLLSYLQGRVKEHPEDQVLVILPLSHDYAGEASSSVGGPKEGLERLAKQIESRRFAVRVLA